MKVIVERVERLTFFVDTDDERKARDMIQGEEAQDSEIISENFVFEKSGEA